MILVHDVSRKSTFDSPPVSKWARQVLSVKPMPIIIVGNKADMPEPHEVQQTDYDIMNGSLPKDKEV